MYSVSVAPGGSRKTLPYLVNTLKKASREGRVDAALCLDSPDLLIVPRGATDPGPAPCRLTVGAVMEAGDVSCGLGPGDALTLSSIREDGAMLSLQRELRTLPGTVLEPQEIPVTLEGRTAPEPEAVLAAAGAMLLLGADPSQGLRL